MRYVYENALCTEVYDGDTVTIEIDFGMRIRKTERFRLFGINAPEVRGSEREQGIKSRDVLREMILNQPVKVQTYRDRKGKFGRYLASIFIGQPDAPLEQCTNVNEWLVENGFAECAEY